MACQRGTEISTLGSLENPVRINGISGEINCLQRLVALALNPFFFH